jgi:hypothetical protein
MTSPAPFYVRICSICGKRINVESSKTDQEGRAVHEECGQSNKSQGQLTRQTSGDVYES